MPRYTDADALLEALKSRRLIFEEGTPVEEAIAEQVSVFEEVIEEAPTADVVPKSEVERKVTETLEYWKWAAKEARSYAASLERAVRSGDVSRMAEAVERNGDGHGQA